MTQSSELRAGNFEVLRLRATQRKADLSVVWSVACAPESESTIHGRVVFGTLQAYGDSGGGEVTGAAIMGHSEDVDYSVEEFENELIGSMALESLYDFLRPVLRGIIATVNGSAKIPVVSPDPVFSLLKRAKDDPADDESGGEPRAEE